MRYRHWAPQRGRPAWRWPCHRKRFGVVGREVWEMPAGFLSALCPGRSRGVKSRDAKPRVDTHGWENKIPEALQPCPAGQHWVSSLFQERSNPLFNKNPLNLTILTAKAFPKNIKLGSQKSQRPSYPGIRPLGGLRSNQNWVQAAISHPWAVRLLC